MFVNESARENGGGEFVHYSQESDGCYDEWHHPDSEEDNVCDDESYTVRAVAEEDDHNAAGDSD